MTIKLLVEVKGGPGSGNWGHAGRPGMVGGSSAASAGVAAPKLLSGSEARSALADGAAASGPVTVQMSHNEKWARRAVRSLGFTSVGGQRGMYEKVEGEQRRIANVGPITSGYGMGAFKIGSRVTFR